MQIIERLLILAKPQSTPNSPSRKITSATFTSCLDVFSLLVLLQNPQNTSSEGRVFPESALAENLCVGDDAVPFTCILGTSLGHLAIFFESGVSIKNCQKMSIVYIL